jgi:hypothetical protein
LNRLTEILSYVALVWGLFGLTLGDTKHGDINMLGKVLMLAKINARGFESPG